MTGGVCRKGIQDGKQALELQTSTFGTSEAFFQAFLVQVRDVRAEHACTLLARAFESGPKPELNFSFEYADLQEKSDRV